MHAYATWRYTPHGRYVGGMWACALESVCAYVVFVCVCVLCVCVCIAPLDVAHVVAVDALAALCGKAHRHDVARDDCVEEVRERESV